MGQDQDDGVFVPITTLQDLIGAHDKASIFFIKCTRPEHTDDVIEDMRKPDNFPGYTVRPLKDLLSLMTSTNIPGLQVFIDAMIALAVSIGLLVIFLTMYTTVIGIRRMIVGGDAANEWQLIMATAMLALLPPAAVVVLMQRWFVKGLVETEK
jgi:sn-glycerol 3-phosphate transport system permease protein